MVRYSLRLLSPVAIAPAMATRTFNPSNTHVPACGGGGGRGGEERGGEGRGGEGRRRGEEMGGEGRRGEERGGEGRGGEEWGWEGREGEHNAYICSVYCIVSWLNQCVQLIHPIYCLMQHTQ